MPEEIEKLERRIADGLEAAQELKRLTAEAQRKDRPKLRLVRGGLIGAGISTGVEWLVSSKAAVVLAAAAVAVAGGVIAEHPGTSGADPPTHAITAPNPRPSVPPTSPRVAPTPRRTSPPRTRASARVGGATLQATQPTSSKPAKPTVEPTKAKPTRTTVPPEPSKVKPRPTVSVSVPPTILTPAIPVVTTPAGSCTGIDLLGICLLGN